jgi:hypothetical protein
VFPVVGLVFFVQRFQHVLQTHFFLSHHGCHAITYTSDLGNLGDEQEGTVPQILYCEDIVLSQAVLATRANGSAFRLDPQRTAVAGD